MVQRRTVVTDEQPVVLPRFALPLGSWLVWGPGAALLIGLVSAGIGFGFGAYDGVSGLAGGGAVCSALFVVAMSVLPWRARDARAWMGWLFAAQMGTLLGSVLACVVMWRALGAEIGPLGFTGAAAFLVGQVCQTAAFSSADRAVREGRDAGSEGAPG